MIEKIPIIIDNEEPVFVEIIERANAAFLVVCKGGSVYLVDSISQEQRFIGKLDFPLTYSDELFKYSKITGSRREFLQIKSHGNYVCVVQKYGLNGIVFDLENPQFRKVLKRGDFMTKKEAGSSALTADLDC